MADDSVVDDDESKIVTKFFVDTSLRSQPSIHHVLAVEFGFRMTTYPTDVTERICSTLVTGSVAEFYIQPMLSCFGDIDLMFHFRDMLAIPDGCPPPSQLPDECQSQVEVYQIINSQYYPGYVYLRWSYTLTESTDADKYDAVQRDGRFYCFPAKHDTASEKFTDQPSLTQGK